MARTVLGRDPQGRVPRGLKENPVLLASRVRLETLEQLVLPAPMVQQGRRAIPGT